jgi:predicted porin
MLTGAVTTGTLSDPRVNDNNGGRQYSGRVAIRPATGLVLGASASRGEWLSRDVARLLPQDLASGGYGQVAWGADAEYSRDHWIVQTELVASRWTLPLTQPSHTRQDVKALGAWIEGRYKLTPRIFVAARADRLGYSRITGTLFSGRPTPWDAPVDRLEAGAGYYVQRNLVARASVQRNHRDGAGVRRRTYVSAQLSYWF